MKIGNATANWQTTTPQRSSSRGGSFAEQLQQATQTQIGADNSDSRTQKMRAIVGKYDLDNLSFNQCDKMIHELVGAGVLDDLDAIMLLPLEAMLTPNGSGNGIRDTAELDRIMVNPRKHAADLYDQKRGSGDEKQTAQALRILNFYDELLATWHQLKGHSNTVSTRA